MSLQESRQKKVNNSVITLNGLRNKVNDYDIVDNYSDFLGESSDGEYSNHSDAVESNLLPSNNNFSLELETDNDPSLIKRSPPISKKKIAFQDETGFFSGLPPPNFKVQFERIKVSYFKCLHVFFFICLYFIHIYRFTYNIIYFLLN